MFTSSRFAPPRTCSSATSTAAPKSPASTMRRKRAEPVTFVRSPIRTKPVSGPISNGSRPLNRVRRLGAAGRPAARGPARPSAIARVCSGVEPQQRAGDVQEPVLRELAQQRRRSRPASRRSRRTRSAGRRSDGSDVGTVATRDSSATYGRISLRAERAVDADDQRLGVLDRGPERLDRLAAQRAAGEVDDGDADPERQLAARPRARRRSPPCVERVEDRLDQQQVDAAVGERRGSARHTPRRPASKVCVRKPGRRPRAERERDVERADRAGDEPPVARPPRARCARRRRSARRRLLEPVVGLPDRRRGERVRGRDVGAGLEVRVVHRAHDSGWVRLSRSGSFVTVARVVARSARRGSRPRPRPRACSSTPQAPSSTRIRSRAIALISLATSRAIVSSGGPKRRASRRPARGLFRRLVTRSPSCRSKLSGSIRPQI